MANVKSGFDSAWSFPTTAALKQWKAAGGQVVSGYLSYDSTKNWTPARIKTVHSLGLGAEMNFEYTATRALSGKSAGVADGKQAAKLLHALYKAVGYKPRSVVIVPFSVDFDTNPGQYPKIDAYLQGAAQGLTSEFEAGDYGEYDLVIHTAKAGTSHMEWQTYAWSGGKFAAGVADFYQWQNSQKLGGADVDYDQVINAAKLGAWWPPGHPLDVPAGKPRPKPGPPAPAVTEEDEMMLIAGNRAQYAKAKKTWPGWYIQFGGGMAHVATVADLTAFKKQGVRSATVARTTFDNMLAAAK